MDLLPPIRLPSLPPYDLSLLTIKINTVKIHSKSEFFDYINKSIPDSLDFSNWSRSQMNSANEPAIFEYKVQINEPMTELLISEYSIFKCYQDFKLFQKTLKTKINEKNLDFKLVLFPKIKAKDAQFIYDFFYSQLTVLLSDKMIRATINPLYEFLAISNFAICNRIPIVFEGPIKKKTKNSSDSCLNFFKSPKFSKKWLILTKEGIGVLQSNRSNEFCDILLFDGNFEVFIGKSNTKRKYGIKITSNSRVFTLKAENYFDFIIWVISIKKIAYQSSSLTLNRFFSSSPIRDRCSCKPFIDGKGYYLDLMESFNKSQKEILISDWFLSPQLYLNRPISPHMNNNHYRLDHILKAAASRGVRIYIIIYNEPPTFYQNSAFVAKCITELHHNIQIIRSPNYFLNVSLWSFHEKLCIIDRKIGYLGGLDLAFGRWDTPAHELADSESLESHNQRNLWIGKDYANPRMKTFLKLREFETCQIDKDSDPRLPWHDIGLRVEGLMVHDMCKHFIQNWNFLKFAKQPLESLTKIFVANCKNSIGKNTKRVNQYCHNILSPLPQKENFVMNGLLKRSLTDAEEDGKNFCVFPKSFHGKDLKDMSKPKVKIFDEIISLYALKADLVEPKNQLFGTCQCQFLRSASHWSLGLNFIENSIHTCYLELIMSAKDFIYIENEYFISGNCDKSVKNMIVEALILRIKKAAAHNEPFKVMVFLPLLIDKPGRLEHNIDFKLIEMFIYKTISHGENSLIEILKKDKNIKNPSDYINFYGLRTHKKIRGVPKTEEIYVNSKIMIIDDDVVVLGSANINDRSLLGSRDAEIAMVIEDSKKIDSFISGKKVKVSNFTHKLRKKLFKEHFALNEELCEDPLKTDLQEIIKENSRKNTEIYREIFRVYPDDHVTKFDYLDNFIRERKLSLYDLLAPKIKGHVVEFPLNWLKDENLEKDMEKENLVLPMKNYT